MIRLCFPVIFLATFVLSFPRDLTAQEFIGQALSNFPAQTVRLEYFSPAALRTLPDYSRLRDRFLGSPMKALERSFSQLSVREENIDEMVIGWLPLPNGYKALGGLARGRFDGKRISASAEQAGIAAEAVGDWSAYCSGDEASCVVVFDDTLAAFGPLGFLAAMREAREGRTPSMVSNARFMNLLGEIRTQPPLWGIALGDAVQDWFGIWLAGPSGATLDWSPLLQSADALTFYANVTEKVDLRLNLDFSSPEAADRLRQTLETLRQLQQLMWQNQAPGRPNPLEGVTLSRAASRVSLTLITDQSQLRESNPFGAAM